MSLTRDAILAAQDWKMVEVQVPEWGGTVWVRTMSIVDQEKYMAMVGARQGTGDIRGLQQALVALVCCDESGGLLFTEEADVAALGLKAWAAMARIIEAAQDLNGMSAKGLEAAMGESAPSR